MRIHFFSGPLFVCFMCQLELDICTCLPWSVLCLAACFVHSMCVFGCAVLKLCFLWALPLICSMYVFVRPFLNLTCRGKTAIAAMYTLLITANWCKENSFSPIFNINNEKTLEAMLKWYHQCSNIATYMQLYQQHLSEMYQVPKQWSKEVVSGSYNLYDIHKANASTEI